MTVITTSISRINNSINALDVTSPDSTELVLEYLEELDFLFRDLAALSVPPEFIAIDNLADEASEYMTLSVSNYNTLFTTVPYDEYTAILAEEHYLRATKRLYYIGELLQGKIPQGDDVLVFTEDDSQETLEEEEVINSQEEDPGIDLLGE